MMEGSPLLSTAYLPPVSYLAHILRAGRAIIEAHGHYQKQSYRNRCRIFTANGPLDLVVPVRHTGGRPQVITEVVIDDSEPWRRLHWRSIRSAYSSAPFFLYYADRLEEVLMKGPDRLFDLNMALLEWLFDSLRVSPGISLSTAFNEITGDGDLRRRIHPKRVPASMPEYYQVFSDRHGFIPDLSAVDLLFNLGPEAAGYMSRDVIP